MLYQNEFSRLKKIYEKMPPARRDMIGPMLALPLVVVALFGLVLMPFGVIGLPGLIFAGALAALMSAAMIATMVDLRKEFDEWRSSAARASQEELPGDVAIRMLSVANDPGAPEQASAPQRSAGKASPS